MTEFTPEDVYRLRSLRGSERGGEIRVSGSCVLDCDSRSELLATTETEMED